jgi:hypothetical protein
MSTTITLQLVTPAPRLRIIFSDDQTHEFTQREVRLLLDRIKAGLRHFDFLPPAEQARFLSALQKFADTGTL